MPASRANLLLARRPLPVRFFARETVAVAKLCVAVMMVLAVVIAYYLTSISKAWLFVWAMGAGIGPVPGAAPIRSPAVWTNPPSRRAARRTPSTVTEYVKVSVPPIAMLGISHWRFGAPDASAPVPVIDPPTYVSPAGIRSVTTTSYAVEFPVLFRVIV